MHLHLNGSTRRSDERGAIAIIVAISMVAVLVAIGMALDFGLVRVDRQVDKSAADAATFAGLEGLDSGDGNAHPYKGICTAIRYLNQNNARFSGVSDASGTWTDGAGGAVGGPVCSNTALLSSICAAGNLSTWARFTWTGTFQGTALTVKIQSGYALPDPAFDEDTLPAAVSDADDYAGGCDQLAVIVTQNRKPGFGSLATSGQLSSTIRSVGRVTSVPGGAAPAMLLLKRTGCPILQTGSNSGGSHVYVLGALSTNGLSQPGTIHADSDGTSCTGGSNQNIFLGKAGNGIVAFAAPSVANPAVADPAKPGLISSVAAGNGITGGVVRDSNDNVCGSNLLATAAAIPATPCLAPRKDVVGRGLVTRRLVDDRYLAAVRTIVATGNATIASHSGFVTPPGNCTPTQAQIDNTPGLNSNADVFIDCTANGGFTAPVTIPGKRFVFAGSVKPAAGTLSLPDAQKVYIVGDPAKDAIALGNGTGFSMHSSGNLSGGRCSNAPTGSATDKAILYVKSGDLKETGGLLQLCYTTAVMGGGTTTGPAGCLPTTSGIAPTATPCPGGANGGNGDGQLSQTGGDVDWTAPNRYDVMTLSDGSPDPARAPEWSDPNGPEDLAFWSESYGGNSNPTYNMAGGGILHIVGVYMVPNADPFTISGGAGQSLTNAQYVATSISLNGTNTSITMGVDPNSAVTLPRLALIGLVR